METRGDRECAARRYLEKHRIMELLNHLTSVLLFFQPEKPRDYLIAVLERLRLAKLTALKTLGLCTADEVLNDDGHSITLDKFRHEVNRRTQEIWSAF
ncbi:EF-hand calcium-binding domain-containing protein 10 isoform X5 [Tamandua tetradactyla]|uniref:EF-hand calcium-binding domain-containing protein 10 isoform X5 n=1 Tax=Tamandua tetradactyla TaxID=48850 RepID=UPI0040546DBC